MNAPPITLRFASGEEPDGYSQGHFALHLERSLSTEDFGQTCMVLVAGTTFLDALIAMFSGKLKTTLRYDPVEATRLSVGLHRKSDRLEISDEKGLLGSIAGETMIEASLRATEALAKLCPPDPTNGGLQNLDYLRTVIAQEIPRISDKLKS